MSAQDLIPPQPGLTDSDMSDHVAEARQRARLVFSGEGHTVAADDWHYSALSGRNLATLLCLLWAVLMGLGAQSVAAPLLLSAGLGMAVFLGLAAGLVTYNEVRHLNAELERERREVQEDPEHEREEIVALYAAKGFREPLLTQIVDVLCVDEDRLLKVMMEEELGLFIRETTHPVVVGLLNGLGAGLVCALLTVPLYYLPSFMAGVWLPAAAAVVVVALAVLLGRHAGQALVPLAARWLLMGGVCTGVAYFLAQWCALGA